MSTTWAQLVSATSNKQPVITVPAIDPTEPPIAIKWTVPSAHQKSVFIDPTKAVDQSIQSVEKMVFYETWDVFQNFGKKGN